MITCIPNVSPQLTSVTKMALAGITKKKTLETMNLKKKG
jgi:hypothetical protein